jgi:GT2 family glycosyltransferase
MMPAWLWLIPKKIIDKSGGWDERLSLNFDFEFSIRILMQVDEVLFCEDAKVYYRSGLASSVSGLTSKKAYEAAFLATHLGCSYLLKADGSDTMKRICANRYKMWVYGIYPDYPELEKKFQDESDKLGGGDITIDGGKIYKLLSSVIGWKPAKKVRLFLAKIKKRK